jgi:hypothetical protein
MPVYIVMQTMSLTMNVINLSDHTDLGLEIWHDQIVLFDGYPIPGTNKLILNIECQDGVHALRFCLKGKTAAHTKIDAHSKILEDAVIRVENICLDEIDINNMVHEHAVYTHDTNGTTCTKHDKFFGTLGCNGEVRLNFSVPFYQWLIDNM